MFTKKNNMYLSLTLIVIFMIVIPSAFAHTGTGWTYGVHSPMKYYSYGTWTEVASAVTGWYNLGIHPYFQSGSTFEAKVWIYTLYSAEAYNGWWQECCYSGSNMIDSNIYLNTRNAPANSCCRQSVISHELGHALGMAEDNSHFCHMHQGYSGRHDYGYESPGSAEKDWVDDNYS